MATIELARNAGQPDPSIHNDGTWFLSDGEEHVELLTDTLFSLDEPWRGRFLALVARAATGSNWNDKQPEREQIAAWLHDLGLCRDLARLLDAWIVPDR